MVSFLLLCSALLGLAALTTSKYCVPVLEHPVIWSMTHLHGSNETAVLNLVYSLKSSPEVYSFATGRLLERVQGVYTHALMSRFFSVEELENYYNFRVDDGHLDLLGLFVEEEIFVDYEDCVENLTVSKSDNVIFHITFITFKSSASNDDMEGTLELVRSMQSVMPSIVLQSTAGKNKMVRENIEKYTHAFVVYLPSEEAVRDMYAHPFYSLVMSKVHQMCDLVLSVDLAQYFPEQLSSSS